MGYGIDDDYLFQFSLAEEDIWVSEYQVLYFAAALCFLLTGVLELYRERYFFHVLMILAGAFGVASAVFVENDVRLSNIFSAVSVHLYLLEGLTWFGEYRRSTLTVEYGKWMNCFVMIGDLEFVIGAFADVILSYFFIFDHTADWDISLMIVYTTAMVLWLHCSLIYMG